MSPSERSRAVRSGRVICALRGAAVKPGHSLKEKGAGTRCSARKRSKKQPEIRDEEIRLLLYFSILSVAAPESQDFFPAAETFRVISEFESGQRGEQGHSARCGVRSRCLRFCGGCAEYTDEIFHIKAITQIYAGLLL